MPPPSDVDCRSRGRVTRVRGRSFQPAMDESTTPPLGPPFPSDAPRGRRRRRPTVAGVLASRPSPRMWAIVPPPPGWIDQATPRQRVYSDLPPAGNASAQVTPAPNASCSGHPRPERVPLRSPPPRTRPAQVTPAPNASRSGHPRPERVPLGSPPPRARPAQVTPGPKAPRSGHPRPGTVSRADPCAHHRGPPPPPGTSQPGPGYSPQRNVRGARRIRMSFAGMPPTTAFAGTSAVTTELVPITELSPTRTPRSTQAP
jgi:hypothetical protein